MTDEVQITESENPDAQAVADRLRAAQENQGTPDEVLTADAVKDQYPKDSLVSLDQTTLDMIITAVSAQFTQQMQTANDRIGTLQQQLERNDAQRHLKNRGQFADGKVKVKGRRVPVVPDHQSALVKLAREENDLSGKYIRFVNTDKNIRSMRRAQGYTPVRLKDGSEVRYMDGVLMSMPTEKYNEEIKKPKQERREFMQSSIQTQFQERLADLGVEASGGISYDDGSELDEIDKVAEIQTGMPAESQLQGE